MSHRFPPLQPPRTAALRRDALPAPRPLAPVSIPVLDASLLAALVMFLLLI